MTKKEIIRKIEDLELRDSGLNHINGTCVVAENVEIDKEKDVVRATIRLIWQMDGKEEVYHNCEYKLSAINKGR